MQIANLAGNTNLLCYKTLAINSTDQFAQVHRPIYNTGAGYMYTTIPYQIDGNWERPEQSQAVVFVFLEKFTDIQCVVFKLVVKSSCQSIETTVRPLDVHFTIEIGVWGEKEKKSPPPPHTQAIHKRKNLL